MSFQKFLQQMMFEGAHDPTGSGYGLRNAGSPGSAQIAAAGGPGGGEVQAGSPGGTIHESGYKIDIDGEMDIETAKAIVFTCLDKCVEEGVKLYGDDYDLSEVGAEDMVQNRIEEIVRKLQNYIKSGNLPIK